MSTASTMAITAIDYWEWCKFQVLRALAYFAADEDERLERYLREMRRCNQIICRIQRERARRIIAEVDAKLRE